MAYSGYNRDWVLGQRTANPYYHGSHDLYDRDWVIARERGAPHVPREIWRYYTPSYGVRNDEYDPKYDRGYSWFPYRGYQLDDAHEHSEFARLAWPTEIPTELRVTIHCERCRFKLYDDLRDLEGVYDVGISGWSNALVTVTGTAPVHKILERAQRSLKHAEIWSNSSDHRRWR